MGRDSASSAQSKCDRTGAESGGTELGVGSGNVCRGFSDVGCRSERCGVEGLCFVVCDVAEAVVVDVDALSHVGGSEHLMFMFGWVLDGTRAVVLRIEAGGGGGGCGAGCDVAEAWVGDSVALLRLGDSRRVVHASERVSDGPWAMVRRSWAGEARGSGGTACDMANSGGGSGRRTVRLRTSRGLVGGPGSAVRHPETVCRRCRAVVRCFELAGLR